MREDNIERRASLPASPEEVWEALTDPARLSDWFGAEVIEADIRPGGRLVFRDDDGVVRRALVERAERPAGLVFRYLPIQEWPDGSTEPVPATTVEIRLTETPEGTELTVVEAPRALSKL